MCIVSLEGSEEGSPTHFWTLVMCFPLNRHEKLTHPILFSTQIGSLAIVIVDPGLSAIIVSLAQDPSQDEPLRPDTIGNPSGV